MIALSCMALIVRALSALVAYVLVWLIAVITNIAFYEQFSSRFQSLDRHQLGHWVVLVPVVGGVIIGLMARYSSEKIRGHGIPEALEAILFGRSRMEPKVAVLKPLSSALSIGTGGPFGAEGPIIMTGGAVGSIFAQCFHLSSAERKTLLVAGAAAGMSAIFTTPVAASFIDSGGGRRCFRGGNPCSTNGRGPYISNSHARKPGRGRSYICVSHRRRRGPGLRYFDFPSLWIRRSIRQITVSLDVVTRHRWVVHRHRWNYRAQRARGRV